VHWFLLISSISPFSSLQETVHRALEVTIKEIYLVEKSMLSRPHFERTHTFMDKMDDAEGGIATDECDDYKAYEQDDDDEDVDGMDVGVGIDGNGDSRPDFFDDAEYSENDVLALQELDDFLGR
jgi:hypothetical protein